jgi:hypothetical protein
VFGFFLLLGVIAGVAALLHDKRGWGTLLDGFATALGGVADHQARRATGTIRGVATSIRLVAAPGQQAHDETHVECRLPPGYPLSLHLRRQRTVDASRIGSGELADVEVGDRLFDAMFLVDGAPAEIVRRLLTPEARGFLLAHSGAVLETDAGLLRLRLDGWVDAADGAAAMECAAGMVARLRDATAEADAAIGGGVTGGPYRPVVDDAPLRDARAARADEVARAESRRRGLDLRAEGYATAVAIAALVLLLLAFGFC